MTSEGAFPASSRASVTTSISGPPGALMLGITSRFLWITVSGKVWFPGPAVDKRSIQRSVGLPSDFGEYQLRHQLIRCGQRAVHADQRRLARLGPGRHHRPRPGGRGDDVADPGRQVPGDLAEPAGRDRLVP